MRKVLFLFIGLIFVSCDSKIRLTPDPYSADTLINGFEVITIDSCEYLYRHVPYGCTMVHKGNCRFCLKRFEEVNL